MKTFIPVFLLLSLCPSLASAQGYDTSSTRTLDSIPARDTMYYSQSDDEEKIYKAEADSFRVDKRPFDKGNLEKLKKDPDLNYRQLPTVAESLWDRFTLWLRQILSNLFQGAVTTNWGRMLVYAMGLVLLVVLIMMILKVNAFKVLYSGEGKGKRYEVLDENIHEMDFEKLIRTALDDHDYRRGIRLLFLYALKLLSDKHLIEWESGKTNHEYLAELGKTELKAGFNELSFYFDYAWYGNFTINRETFQKAQHIFTAWKTKLT